MKLSIVIATRNRSNALLNCVNSVAASGDGVDYEIVVVDNHSTDDTETRIRKLTSDGKIPIQYLYEPRPGTSRSRNKGALACKGDLLIFTDDDCILSKGHLQRIRSHFIEDLELAMAGGRVVLHDPNALPIGIRIATVAETMTSATDVGNFIIGANMAMRRETFERCGGFNERLGPGTMCRAAEDIDLVYTAFKLGFKVRYLPDALVYHDHRRHHSSHAESVRRNYTIGLGAFYMSHILRRDMRAARLLYWYVTRLLRRRNSGHVRSIGARIDTVALVAFGMILMALSIFTN